MLGTPTPTSIAISIAIGTSLLGGFFSMWIAIRSTKSAAANRDTTVSILFGIAMLLIPLNAASATLLAAGGMAYAGLEKTTLLLTAAFAALGTVCGLMRSLRSASAGKTQRA